MTLSPVSDFQQLRHTNQGSGLQLNGHVSRPFFEKARVNFTTTRALMYNLQSLQKPSERMCGKQLGVPDSPVWGRNSETVSRGGVKFSGGVVQTRSPRSTLDSPSKKLGAQHRG